MLTISLISLFPEMFDVLKYGIVGRAIKDNLVSIKHWNPRDFTTDKYRRVDDKPYGGGPGMVMLYEPLHKAIAAAKNAMPYGAKVIYLTPQGKKLVQNDFVSFIQQKHEGIIFVLGRYEGIDERVILQDIDEEWSIGDYVISGGEIAAMVCIDAMVRLIPGALNKGSLNAESFTDGKLDYPQYTRPEIIDGMAVPEILLTGDHSKIAEWRKEKSEAITLKKRPDLYENIHR